MVRSSQLSGRKVRVLGYRSRTPLNLRGSPSGFSSFNSAGSRADGAFWYATGRSHRSMAVPPTEVDVEVVAG
jgi:hypothetical protein